MKTYPLYLNGAFVPSESAWDVVNPATEEPFARISTISRRSRNKWPEPAAVPPI